MGGSMPRPELSVVVERHGATVFDVGVAEMNGWRDSMEDAHLIITRESWGFFGVFDGHGGEACSKFVARRLREELEANGCPGSDAEAKKLMLDIDAEFLLDTEQPSGSTGTMCIVRKPEGAGAKHQLHVINVGDSRVLLGHPDGTMFEGGGTDGGLTVDHKPDHPLERKRVYRCGGTVESGCGCQARVNGDLAVSRAFGDPEYKKTGGPGPEDRPVTADPEMFHFECDEADFLLLVCDGVSEGQFPNREVVKLVAKHLQEGKDAGFAAREVCRTAISRDSKDNVTCMIVRLSGAAHEGVTRDFHPGSVGCMEHVGFRAAYTAMAERGGLTIAQAVAKRLDHIAEQCERDPGSQLRYEASEFGLPDGVLSSPPERAAFIEEWAREQEAPDKRPGA